MKVALCCMFKMENDYLDEWVNHYIKLGFDHLFMIDNNDVDGEYCEDVLTPQQLQKITIINKRGVKPRLGIQYDIYNEFYHGEYLNGYDWMIFLDCDEFLELTQDSDIHDYLNRQEFQPYDGIRVQWLCYSWGKQYYKTEGLVQERFTEVIPECCNGMNSVYKTFFRTKITDLTMLNAHNSNIKNICNNKGEKIEYGTDCHFLPANHDNAYVKHYFTKSLEEYIKNKMKRGDINYVDRFNVMFDFFNINGPFDTDEEYEEFMKIVEKIKND